MKKPKSNHAATPRRRMLILDAALACFTEFGVAGSSVNDICERAGVSVGSLYHHFSSMEGLAGALYLEGIRSYQEGLALVLTQNPSAREGIHSIIRYHLTWVKKNRDWARFLFHERHAEFMGSTEGEISVMNLEFIGQVSRWMVRCVESGELRTMAVDIFLCLLLGPCQEYSRLFLSGVAVTPLERAITEIGNSAWNAMSSGVNSVVDTESKKQSNQRKRRKQ